VAKPDDTAGQMEPAGSQAACAQLLFVATGAVAAEEAAQ
jgi:hypothetical protein